MSVFPDVSNYFIWYDAIITDKNDSHTYKNKTQVVINQDYPLMIHFKEQIKTDLPKHNSVNYNSASASK